MRGRSNIDKHRIKLAIWMTQMRSFLPSRRLLSSGRSFMPNFAAQTLALKVAVRFLPLREARTGSYIVAALSPTRPMM
jgi:hypothetical protein